MNKTYHQIIVRGSGCLSLVFRALIAQAKIPGVGEDVEIQPGTVAVLVAEGAPPKLFRGTGAMLCLHDLHGHVPVS